MGASALSITDRPRFWDEVIGQDRAISVLKSILRGGQFTPRGFVLEGPHGVGKTSVALILTKALMCIGGEPLGCGACPSCQGFNAGVDGHPDFREVDGASYSGVAQARQIVDESQELPGVAKTRVLLVDEAHRLSREAWDVYLKPLEQPLASCVFIFATTDAKRIPSTILSRCCTIRFSKVSTETLSDYLSAVSARHNISCESSGIKFIAKAAKGHVRDALGLLDKVSSMGRVTRALAETVVDTSYADMAAHVLVYLIAGQLPKAMEVLDEMARTQPASRAIAEVFSAYGRAVFADPSASAEESQVLGVIRAGFVSYSKVTETMIKWSSSDRIPVDALPLFIQELHSLRTLAPEPDPVVSPQADPVSCPKAGDSLNSGSRLLSLVGAIELEG